MDHTYLSLEERGGGGNRSIPSSDQEGTSTGMMMELPPGFRFHPTDEEIITHYLLEKVINRSFSAAAIADADFNKCEPWDLPKKAKMGEKEWYFFSQRDRKYPTGMRTNRATQSGYWKATGKDKEIYSKAEAAPGARRSSSVVVGMKKTLVFYTGRAPKGNKSNWVMHEFRLHNHNHNHRLISSDEWVVSKVFHKTTTTAAAATTTTAARKPPTTPMLSVEDMLSEYNNSDYSLPPLTDASSSFPAPPYYNCKAEIDHQSFTTTTAAVTHSQDTGLTTDNIITAEISSVPVPAAFYNHHHHDFHDDSFINWDDHYL